MDLSPHPGFLKSLKVNRYENDFTDMEKIGRGGYASVYKARNKVDGHFYAIKKIKLRMKDVKKNFNRELQRVLDEAKYLAEVNHQNILRYYNSWLEVTTKPKKPNLQLLRVPSDIKGDSEGKEDSGRVDDSDEDSSFFAFDRSNREPPKLDSKKFDIGQQAILENRKSSFYLKIGETFSNRSLSEDVDKNNSFRSEEEKPPRSKTKEKGSVTPRTGDEILDSMTLYIQTELCNETLEDYLSKRNELLQRLKSQSPKEYEQEKRTYYKEAVVFAKQILSGLSHIHSHFIVHRDLKPSNIFLVNKTLKIGDFGLVKRLNSFSPMESSPFMVGSAEKDDDAYDGFKLDNSNSPSNRDRLQNPPEILFQKNYSEPANANQPEPDFYLEVDEPITKSVGTRTFASPEQLKADKEKFDQRADIFSLGIIYLLLFYPMTTFMEQTQTIKESKKGKIPKILEEELPEIAKIIKKMLSDHPSDRPSLQVISRSLVLPIEMQSDLTGSISVKRENSFTWRKKYFKLIDNNLYLFSQEADSKAESVYNLSQWRILFKGSSSNEVTCISTDEESNSLESEEGGCKKSLSYIALENPMQLGCIFTAESYNQTLEIYKKFQNLETSAQ